MRTRSSDVIVIGDDVFMLDERVAKIVLPNSTLRGKFETFLQEMVREATIEQLHCGLTNALCKEICAAVKDIIDDVHKYDSIKFAIGNLVANCIDDVIEKHES